jgi:chromate transport protein ChrA
LPSANKPHLALYAAGVGWQLHGIRALFVAYAARVVAALLQLCGIRELPVAYAVRSPARAAARVMTASGRPFFKFEQISM